MANSQEDQVHSFVLQVLWHVIFVFQFHVILFTEKQLCLKDCDKMMNTICQDQAVTLNNIKNNKEIFEGVNNAVGKDYST